MQNNYDIYLSAELEIAAEKAINNLFSNGENFYYCSLITTGEGLSPCLTAWSYEALDRERKIMGDDQEDILMFKWSYADSPYFNFGSEYFLKVKEIIENRPQLNFEMTTKQWLAEFDIRINSMEKALYQLDLKGLFGRGISRKNIVINAEVMPPDEGNTIRAKRLNPAEALTNWLVEIGEG